MRGKIRRGTGARGATAEVSRLRTTARGDEIWTVKRDGRTERVIASVSSIATMDSATVRYNSALKSLAKK